MKEVIKRYKFFLILVTINIALLVLFPSMGQKSINITWSNTLEMLSVIPPIFILLGLLDVCCSNCEKLQKLTEEVVKETSAPATVEKVSDMQKIMGYGVMRTPAIVINGKVKAMGRVPGKDKIKKYIQDESK